MNEVLPRSVVSDGKMRLFVHASPQKICRRPIHVPSTVPTRGEPGASRIIFERMGMRDRRGVQTSFTDKSERSTIKSKDTNDCQVCRLIVISFIKTEVSWPSGCVAALWTNIYEVRNLAKV